MKSADIAPMEHDYRQMTGDERLRHHDDLLEDGFEWCPECGSTLVWELPELPAASSRTAAVPVVIGDFPPLTADQIFRN